jgi:DNA repair protein RadC
MGGGTGTTDAELRNAESTSAGSLVDRSLASGPQALETVELLALIGGARAARVLGARDGAALDLADLVRATPGALAAGGLTRAAAARLAAAFELARRAARAVGIPRSKISGPGRVHELLLPEILGLDREVLWVLLLDGRHRLKRVHRAGIGTLGSSLVHPREVFKPALTEGAAAVILAHNHPSGDPEPSAEDLAITRRLQRVGELIGIPLLDHVVVCAGDYRSARVDSSGGAEPGASAERAPRRESACAAG